MQIEMVRIDTIFVNFTDYSEADSYQEKAKMLFHHAWNSPCTLRRKCKDKRELAGDALAFMGWLIWKELRSGLFSCPFWTLHIFSSETGSWSMHKGCGGRALDMEISEYPMKLLWVHKALEKEKCTCDVRQCCIIQGPTPRSLGLYSQA